MAPFAYVAGAELRPLHHYMCQNLGVGAVSTMADVGLSLLAGEMLWAISPPEGS